VIPNLLDGWFAVLELPLWFIVREFATLYVPDVAEVEWPDDSWEIVRSFDRFPQGMPVRADRAKLLPKAAREGEERAAGK
jgi:hypothetical protein